MIDKRRNEIDLMFEKGDEISQETKDKIML